MRVLIACECSGRVRDSFTRLGHDAWSCDLLPCEIHSDKHMQCDIRDVVYDDWDAVIAFPPCTDIAVSGARHFALKQTDGRQQKAIDFFMLFTRLTAPLVAIENPIGIMSSIYRKPDQIIQPYFFGDMSKKSTCLWLKGFPLLVPTNVVSPHIVVSGGKKFSADYLYKAEGDPSRQYSRSKTYMGIAMAMAYQWGGDLEFNTFLIN